MVRTIADSNLGRYRRGLFQTTTLTAVISTALTGAIVAALPGAAAAQDASQGDPSVELTAGVYPGADGGAGCASAPDYAEAGQTDIVTYCVTVTNTGGTSLDAIVIASPHFTGEPVLISADSEPLDQAHSARYYIESVPPPDDADGVIDDTYTTVATVSAQATDSGRPVDATAQVVVYPAEEIPVPGVELTTDVYGGTDAGVGCPATDSVSVHPGDPITYCFQVVNTGNTYLDAIEITDPIFGFAENAGAGQPILVRSDSQPLAPGSSAYYYLDAIAPGLPSGGLLTTSAVTANSVAADGSDLTGLPDAFDNDAARLQVSDEVQSPTPNPASPASVPPAAASPAPSPPSPPSPAAEAPATTSNSTSSSSSAAAATEAKATAPATLAYTGWETPILFSAALGLIAGGRSLVRSGQAEAAADRRRKLVGYAGGPPER